MASKCLFLMALGLLMSSVGLVNGGGDGDTTDSMPCMKKLIPCQPYLHDPEKVPASCCLPLKQMVSDDVKCLCGVFNNIEVLKKINLTRDEALKLPKACGANADISICQKDSTSPPKSPGTPSTPSSHNSPKKSAAHSHSRFSGSGHLKRMALLISAAAAAAAF